MLWLLFKKRDNDETINDIHWLTRCYTDFNKLVNDCIPPLTRRSSLSSIHQVLQQTSPSHKCSKRARRYMLAYSAFNIIDAEESGTSSNSGNDDEDMMNNILTHKVIEKAIQTYKRHHTVDNIDPKWIKNLMLDVKEELLVQKVVKKMRELSNNTLS